MLAGPEALRMGCVGAPSVARVAPAAFLVTGTLPRTVRTDRLTEKPTIMTGFPDIWKSTTSVVISDP
jgi:hypothetical protein